MKYFPLSEAKMRLSELVDKVSRRDRAFTITKNGKSSAVVMSPDEYEGWQETLAIRSDPDFMKEIRQGVESLKRSRKRFALENLADLFELKNSH